MGIGCGVLVWVVHRINQVGPPWWPEKGLNLRRRDFHSRALPLSYRAEGDVRLGVGGGQVKMIELLLGGLSGFALGVGVCIVSGIVMKLLK